MFRLFKDLHLERTKAYNLSLFADFVRSDFECFYKQSLLDVCFNKVPKKAVDRLYPNAKDVKEVQVIEEEIEFNKNWNLVILPNPQLKKFKKLVLESYTDNSVGEYVLVLYDGNSYPVVITEIEGAMVEIKAIVRSLKFWIWLPGKILGAINAHRQITKRGLYFVPA